MSRLFPARHLEGSHIIDVSQGSFPLFGCHRSQAPRGRPGEQKHTYRL